MPVVTEGKPSPRLAAVPLGVDNLVRCGLFSDIMHIHLLSRGALIITRGKAL